jgi:hypothetical protein
LKRIIALRNASHILNPDEAVILVKHVIQK